MGNIVGGGLKRESGLFSILTLILTLAIDLDLKRHKPVLRVVLFLDVSSSLALTSQKNCGAAAVKLRGFRMTSTISLKSLSVSPKDIWQTTTTQKKQATTFAVCRNGSSPPKES